MDVLEKLDKLRRAKGLSVFKLTELSGLSENTIYNWYNKGCLPTIYALKSVCEVLDITLSEFFAETEAEHLSAQEEKLVLSFRRLPERQKELYLNLISELANGEKSGK